MSQRQELKAVYEVAEKYIEAGRTGNIELMKEVFHEDAFPYSDTLKAKFWAAL